VYDFQNNNRELRIENANLLKNLDEKQRLIDSLKTRKKRDKSLQSSLDNSSTSVGTIQNIKSEKLIHAPRVFSIKEEPAVDVSVSSTGSEIKRRLQASLKIYPTDGNNTDDLDRHFEPQNTYPQLEYQQPSQAGHPPASTWVSRAPHLAHVIASYKPEEKVPSFSLNKFPPLFANAYMPFSHVSTAVPSAVTTPTALRSPQQQSINWQIPPPVLFGLGGAPYSNRAQN